MINNVVLVGRLTKDIDLRYTGNGTAVGNFTLAVNRKVKSDGQPTADFINCVAWKKTAEIIANHTKKGSQVGVEGSIQTRSYDNNEGKRVYITEVLVQSVTLLDSKSENGNGNGNESNKQSSNNTTNTPSNMGNDPFDRGSQPIDISDDDLPF